MVYDRIRALRQEKGLTQKQVAEYLEVSVDLWGVGAGAAKAKNSEVGGAGGAL